MDGILFLKTMLTATSLFTFYRIYNNLLVLQKIYSQENFTFNDDLDI